MWLPQVKRVSMDIACVKNSLWKIKIYYDKNNTYFDKKKEMEEMSQSLITPLFYTLKLYSIIWRYTMNIWGFMM